MQFRSNLESESRSSSEIESAELCQPQLFDAGCRDRQLVLRRLVRRGAVASTETAITHQIRELMECRHPITKGDESEQWRRAVAHLAGTPIAEYGTWVFYPWNRKLVQVLPKSEFREVRNSRNRYKIDKHEQDVLSTRRVGIVGLSVGHAIALVMAMEGCAKEYRLADPDVISLSNLNRLPGGIGDIGLNKAVFAARRMYETDPYLKIVVVAQRVSEATVERFMLEGGKLDLVVEECDDLFMKVYLRERARSLQIPVLMETNDRGMLDVERFDLEPERPILHGLLGQMHTDELRTLSDKEKISTILKLLGGKRISQRLARSLGEINKSILSWPQLGSGAILGGGVAGDAARRLLTGELNVSGRFYVDVHEIVSNSSAAVSKGDASANVTAAELEQGQPGQATSYRTAPYVRSEPSEGMVRNIVAAGVLAPSGGNIQPWKFIWTRESRLRCVLDPIRSTSFLDFERRAAYLSFGAVVENMRLAALEAGYTGEITPFPQPDRTLVCEIAFRPMNSPISVQDLLAARAIEDRVTNRRLSKRVAIAQNDLAVLIDIAASRGAELQVLTNENDLTAIGAILGEGDRFRFLYKTLNREMMTEMRWNPRETADKRDGIDIDTLELRDAEKSGLRLLSSWKVFQVLKHFGAGRIIERSAQLAVESASALALLLIPGISAESYFAGGQVMESIWLTATVMGLAFQPMSTLPYMFGRLESGSGFEATEIKTLATLRMRYKQLFRIDRDVAELLLFRLAVAGPPKCRSMRRPVEEMLSFE